MMPRGKMSGRGEYSAIHTAVVDAPDFQALGPDARLCFYTVKMILGPSGIEVVRCFVAQMTQLTGLPESRLRVALDELQAGKWLAQQGDVVWLRNGLKFNPGCNLNNEKHKTGVIRHLQGLPRLAIVNAFCKHYDLPETASGMGIEWVSDTYGKHVEVKVEGKGISSVPTEQAQAPKILELPSNPKGAFAGLVKKHFWLQSEPPALMLRDKPNWTMGNEISIGEQWAKDYGGWDNVLGIIPLFRKVLDIDDDQPLSCLFFNRGDARHKINQVIGHYDKQRELDASRAGNSFKMRIGA